MFTHSIETGILIKEVLKDIPVGSIHACGFLGRLTHFPDTNELEALKKYGILPRIRNIPLDYVISPGTKEVINEKPYIANRANSRQAILKAREKQAIGAFVYAEPERVLEML